MCCPALLSACGNHSGEAERCYGIGLKLFGFIPEPVFTFIPESCSRSSRNTVRNHPGIAFTLLRNLQTIKHDDSEEMLFKVRWIVHDINGHSGELFIVNSFSSEPDAQ